MATRNILNYQGIVIGQLTLDDDASELEWSNALSPYAQPPTPIKIIVMDKIKDYKKVAADIIDALKADNTLAGITLAQSDQMFDDFEDVLLRLREGALPTAIYRLQHKSPSGFVTQDMIDAWILLIKSYL